MAHAVIVMSTQSHQLNLRQLPHTVQLFRAAGSVDDVALAAVEALRDDAEGLPDLFQVAEAAFFGRGFDLGGGDRAVGEFFLLQSAATAIV